MKLRVGFKTPDALYYAIEEYADSCVKEDVEELAGNWIKCGESVTIEIDTEKGTAVVCKI